MQRLQDAVVQLTWRRLYIDNTCVRVGGSAIWTNSAADNRTDRVEDVESPLPVFFEHETVGDVLFAHARVTVCQVPRNATSSIVGPPCSRTNIYAARMSRGSSGYRSISAARARPQQHTRRPPLLLLSIDGTDRQTDGRTDTRPFYDARRIRYDTIRYDTRCYFNVRSKADIGLSQLNLPHGNDN